jgi:hypothetical protein
MVNDDRGSPIGRLSGGQGALPLACTLSRGRLASATETASRLVPERSLSTPHSFRISDDAFEPVTRAANHCPPGGASRPEPAGNSSEGASAATDGWADVNHIRCTWIAGRLPCWRLGASLSWNFIEPGDVEAALQTRRPLEVIGCNGGAKAARGARRGLTIRKIQCQILQLHENARLKPGRIQVLLAFRSEGARIRGGACIRVGRRAVGM